MIPSADHSRIARIPNKLNHRQPFYTLHITISNHIFHYQGWIVHNNVGSDDTILKSFIKWLPSHLSNSRYRMHSKRSSDKKKTRNEQFLLPTLIKSDVCYHWLWYWHISPLSFKLSWIKRGSVLQLSHSLYSIDTGDQCHSQSPSPPLKQTHPNPHRAIRS